MLGDKCLLSSCNLFSKYVFNTFRTAKLVSVLTCDIRIALHKGLSANHFTAISLYDYCVIFLGLLYSSGG